MPCTEGTLPQRYVELSLYYLRDPVNVRTNYKPNALLAYPNDSRRTPVLVPAPYAPLCLPIFVSAHVHRRTSYCALR